VNADDKRNKSYTYLDAGFNGFFRRTLASDPTQNILNSSAQGGKGSREINLDEEQFEGFMGDVLQVGRVTIDGRRGAVSVFDENKNEVGRLGPYDG